MKNQDITKNWMDFNAWIKDGNAHFDGKVWREQSTQYRVKFSDKSMLYKFFLREYVEGI